MSIRYEPEPAPDEYSSEWIERQFRGLSAVLSRSLDLDPSQQVQRPREGMVRYFDASVYDPGGGTGFYVYTGGAWVTWPAVSHTHAAEDPWTLEETITATGTEGTIEFTTDIAALTDYMIEGTDVSLASGSEFLRFDERVSSVWTGSEWDIAVIYTGFPAATASEAWIAWALINQDPVRFEVLLKYAGDNVPTDIHIACWGQLGGGMNQNDIRGFGNSARVAERVRIRSQGNSTMEGRYRLWSRPWA